MKTPSPVFAKFNIPIGVPWGPIVTIPANTDLSTLGYPAIASETGFTVYWGNDASSTYNWPAHTAFVVHPTAKPKLVSDTLCVIVG
jgi:hypothetical protein